MAYGCTYKFEWVEPYAVVKNDDGCVDQVLASAAKAVGEKNVSIAPPSSGSEDFSAFTKEVPGAFVMINGDDASEGLPFQNHRPKFNVIEKPTIMAGVRTQVQLVLDELAGS